MGFTLVFRVPSEIYRVGCVKTQIETVEARQDLQAEDVEEAAKEAKEFLTEIRQSFRKAAGDEVARHVQLVELIQT